MLIFFDYLFFGLRKFYNENKDSGAGWSALAVIALTQTLNILTGYFIYEEITKTVLNVNKLKLAFLALYFLVFILNVVRYSKLDMEIIKEKWENKKEKQKVTIRALIVLYLFLSVAVCVGLAIYIGNKRNS